MLEQLLDHFAADLGQPLFAPLVQVAQRVLIQPELVQDRGVDVAEVDAGFDVARRPMSSVAPTIWPPLMPPPAIHIVKPRLWWSRPLPPCASGERPNSPPQSTSVESSSPRCFRSFSSAATG